jgi:hypothetical protein
VRRVRALIFTVACAFGAVLFSAGATVSDASDLCATTAAARAGCEEHLGTVVTRTTTGEPVAGAAVVAGDSSHTDASAVAAGSSEPGAGTEGVPPVGVSPAVPETAAFGHHGRTITATAVMHVPTPGQPASDGQMEPLTDKAMVLLIGWVMLVLLGGGICAGSTQTPNRRRVPGR